MYWSGECARISANVAGTDGKPQGVPFWSDAALFNQFGKISCHRVRAGRRRGGAFQPRARAGGGAHQGRAGLRLAGGVARRREELGMLEVRNLSVSFPGKSGRITVVDDVSVRVAAGEVLGIVGESGCGKSVTALSIMRLVTDPPGRARRRRGPVPGPGTS